MSNARGDYQIPFDADGSQQDYPQPWRIWDGVNLAGMEGPHWRDNHVFTDTLTLVAYGRGRSSVTFTMRRTDGTTVSVFVSDFMDMARVMVSGALTGRFTFSKKGAHYGCRMAREGE